MTSFFAVEEHPNNVTPILSVYNFTIENSQCTGQCFQFSYISEIFGLTLDNVIATPSGNNNPLIININSTTNDFNVAVQNLRATEVGGFVAFVGYNSNVTVAGNLILRYTRMPLFYCESDSAWLNAEIAINEYSDGPFFFDGAACPCLYNGTDCSSQIHSSPTPASPPDAGSPPPPAPVPSDADNTMIYVVVGCTAAIIATIIAVVGVVLYRLRGKPTHDYDVLNNETM